MQVTNLSIVIETVENKDELIPNVKTPERILNEDISIKSFCFFPYFQKNPSKY